MAMAQASDLLPSYSCNCAFCYQACCRGLKIYPDIENQLTSICNGLPCPPIPCCAPEPSPGELLPMTGLESGGPDTGVPGFEPIGRGEFIIPPPGLDMGREVAGECGLGLAPGPGCCLPAG